MASIFFIEAFKPHIPEFNSHSYLHNILFALNHSMHNIIVRQIGFHFIYLAEPQIFALQL